MFMRRAVLVACPSAGLAPTAGSTPADDDFAGSMEQAVQRMHAEMHVALSGDAATSRA
jgi:hypothetical protein